MSKHKLDIKLTTDIKLINGHNSIYEHAFIYFGKFDYHHAKCTLHLDAWNNSRSVSGHAN